MRWGCCVARGPLQQSVRPHFTTWIHLLGARRLASAHRRHPRTALLTAIPAPTLVVDTMSAVWQRVLEAHHEVASPTVIDQGHWVNAAIVVGCVMLILTAFHRIVAVRFKRQYFTLHVFANSIIVYLTYVVPCGAHCGGLHTLLVGVWPCGAA